MQYVGETSTSVKTLLNSHRYNSTHQKKMNTYLVAHFQRHNPDRATTWIIAHNPNWSTQESSSTERKWTRLNTKFPDGLNEK